MIFKPVHQSSPVIVDYLFPNLKKRVQLSNYLGVVFLLVVRDFRRHQCVLCFLSHRIEERANLPLLAFCGETRCFAELLEPPPPPLPLVWSVEGKRRPHKFMITCTSSNYSNILFSLYTDVFPHKCTVPNLY